VASFAAGEVTGAVIGVQRWVVHEDASGGFRVDGVDRLGSVLQQVYIRQFGTEIRRADGQVDHGHGYEIATSNGGLLRVTLAGHVLSRVDDPDVLGSFARDVEAARSRNDGTIPFGCSFWRWLECAGTVALVFVECATLDPACIASFIVAAGSCGECVADAVGGGGGGGGGGSCDPSQFCCSPIYNEYTGQIIGCN
jgi:hypothetical protein